MQLTLDSKILIQSLKILWNNSTSSSNLILSISESYLSDVFMIINLHKSVLNDISQHVLQAAVYAVYAVYDIAS